MPKRKDDLKLIEKWRIFGPTGSEPAELHKAVKLWPGEGATALSSASEAVAVAEWIEDWARRNEKWNFIRCTVSDNIVRFSGERLGASSNANDLEQQILKAIANVGASLAIVGGEVAPVLIESGEIKKLSEGR